MALSALCAQVPALVYALSLSLFGMAHVLAEMRYVDGQFGERLGPRAWIPMVALLAAIFTTRLVQIAGGWPPGWGLSVEMGLGLALAAIPLPSLARSGILGLTGGITLCGLWITGWILAPTAALLVFAVSHNATPVGLLIDAAPAPEKARVAGLSAAVFVGIPLWMAVVGWEPLLGPALPWTLPALPLERAVAAYVPTSWGTDAAALRWFSAAVFAQCLHYFAVLVLLPRTGPPEPRLPWPNGWALVGVAALLAAGFAVSFVDARLLYSPFAAVHAWVEVPLLMYAMVTPKRGGAVTGTSRSRR